MTTGDSDQPRAGSGPAHETPSDSPSTVRPPSFTALARQHGFKVVYDQALGMSIRLLHKHREQLRLALQTNSLEALQQAPKPGVAALAFMLGLDLQSAESLRYFLTRQGFPSVRMHRELSELLTLAMPQKEQITSQVSTAPRNMADYLLRSDEYRSDFISSVTDAGKQLKERQQFLLTNYRDTLTTLQHSLLSGVDIRKQLAVMATSSTFSETLDVLQATLTRADRGSAQSDLAADDAEALQFLPIISTWGEVKLWNYGRVNHWTELNSSSYLNLTTGFPQLELRLHSNGREIFYTRDDVDDLVDLATEVLEHCADAVQEALSRSSTLADDFADMITSRAAAAINQAQRIRDLFPTEGQADEDET